MIDTQINLGGELSNQNQLNGELVTTNKLNAEIYNNVELNGEVSTDNKISGEINSNIKLDGTLRNNVNLNGDIHVGAGGTRNYEYLYNQPSINEVKLIKNKSFEDLGMNEITNTELNKMFSDL